METEENFPLVSVIVPTYRRHEKLKNCLDSLSKSSYKNIEVIVVNDDPNDDLKDFVEQYGARYIQNQAEGFVIKCRNIGAKMSKGEILFFVDDDNVFEPDTISSLVKKYVVTEKIGLIGPLMFDSDGELWFWGSRLSWFKPFPSKQSVDFSDGELIRTDVVPNAYMIYRDLYFKIGGEDESLLFYDEELDLAVRLKNSGFISYIYTGSKIVHDYGHLFEHISSFRLFANFRSMLIVERRYANMLQFTIFFVYFVGYALFYALYRIPYSMHVKNKHEYYSSMFRGIKEGLFSTSKFTRKA
ncbi:MAG: glycosyltransferase family 2 protein [Nitrososphaerota archaeon]